MPGALAPTTTGPCTVKGPTLRRGAGTPDGARRRAGGLVAVAAATAVLGTAPTEEEEEEEEEEEAATKVVSQLLTAEPMMKRMAAPRFFVSGSDASDSFSTLTASHTQLPAVDHSSACSFFSTALARPSLSWRVDLWKDLERMARREINLSVPDTLPSSLIMTGDANLILATGKRSVVVLSQIILTCSDTIFLQHEDLFFREYIISSVFVLLRWQKSRI